MDVKLITIASKIVIVVPILIVVYRGFQTSGLKCCFVLLDSSGRANTLRQQGVSLKTPPQSF